MRTSPATSGDDPNTRSFAHRRGEEPLPGYTLLEPLGRGGFGEVWKCEAPGGLHKAVKFVGANGDGFADDGTAELEQELAAFQQIKAIRHPFLLTLERVELVGGELVMVMELADRQLHDRFQECVAGGLPGIPRGELLGCLADAAEALDMIAARFGLQHLDVKPANLFLTSGRVKVGDYGLVSRLEGAEGRTRGLTPRYVSPEALQGKPSPRSDQYSLAVVYHELLTGALPYPANNPRQLMLQHLAMTPDLARLPEHDRPAVGRALAKTPDERFPSCLDFVRALLAADPGPLDPALVVRQARYGNILITPGPLADPQAPTKPNPAAADEPTQNVTIRAGQPPTIPDTKLTLRTPAPRRPAAPPPPPPAEEEQLPVAEEADDRVNIGKIRSVLPVDRLLGNQAADPLLSATAYVAAIVDAAAAGERLPVQPGEIGRAADGAWVVRFPTTAAGAVIPFKLQTVADEWGATIERPAADTVVLRKPAPAGMWASLKKKGGGMEVVVRLGPGRGVGEVTVTARVYGVPDAAFGRSAATALPQVVDAARRELQTLDERRKHPRVPADFPVALYPIHSDGSVDAAIPARCKDVSAGGVGLVVAGPLPTKYVFAVFEGVPAAAGHAVLLRLVRKENQPGNPGYTYGAMFRTDF
jgi:serine/threonine protein kinase